MKTLLVTLGLLGLMVGAATAADASSSLKAKVPFDFKIGNNVLPAGEYYVAKDGRTGVLSVRSLETDAVVIFLADRVHSNETTEQARLVFNTYGDHYYLREVWMAGMSSGSSISKGKAQREMAGRAAIRSVVVVAR